MQLSQYVSTVANGGKRLIPQYVESIHRPSYGSELGPAIYSYKTKLINELEATNESVSRTKDAMRCTVTCANGLAKNMANSSYNAAAKTGTAETYVRINDQLTYGYNSTFIGYAPYDNPEIAVSIIIPLYTMPEVGSSSIQGYTIGKEIFDA